MRFLGCLIKPLRSPHDQDLAESTSGRDWWHVIAQPITEKLLISFNLQFIGFAQFETQTLDHEPSLLILSPYSDKCETHKWPRAWLKALGGGRGTKKESFFLLGLPTSFLSSLDTPERVHFLKVMLHETIHNCSQSTQTLANHKSPTNSARPQKKDRG